MSKKIISGSGDPFSSIMVVGMMPGKAEEKQGISFCGKNGEAIRNLFQDIGITTPYYTNLVKYRCKDLFGRPKDVKDSDIYACKHLLIKELQMMRPKVVVAMGQKPLEHLSNQKLPITLCHGLPTPTKKYGMDYTLFPMFDMGYVNRMGGLFSEVGEKWLFDLELLYHTFQTAINDNNIRRNE